MSRVGHTLQSYVNEPKMYMEIKALTGLWFLLYVPLHTVKTRTFIRASEALLTHRLPSIKERDGHLA